MQNIKTNETLQIDDIYFDKPELEDNTNNINIKLWYNFNTNPNTSPNTNPNPNTLQLETFFIKYKKQVVYEKNETELIFFINDENKIFFDLLDKKIIQYIQKSKILKKIGLKGMATYRTIISEADNNNNKVNILRTNFSNVKMYDKSKTLITNMDVLVKNTKCDIIVEPFAIVIDVNNKVIYTNIYVRQIVVNQDEIMKPKKIELLDYSLINSETSSDDEYTKASDNNEDNNFDAEDIYNSITSDDS